MCTLYRTIKQLLLFPVLLFGTAFVAAADYSGPTYGDKPRIITDKVNYIFSVHPLHNPIRLFEVYQPLVDLINKNTNEFSLSFEASRDYSTFEEKLYSRKFHIALPNPYQTILSEQYGYEIAGKMGDDSRFRGIIIMRKDSPIERVADLRGAAISFPARTALAATMLPKYFLFSRGLDLKGNILKYVGSQESSIMNVYFGKTKAGGTWPPPWELFIQRRPELAKQLVVKWETPSLVNNGLVIRKDIPDAHRRRILEIIFSLHKHEKGRKILKSMDLSRFERANSASFGMVREFMKKYSEAFGE